MRQQRFGRCRFEHPHRPIRAFICCSPEQGFYPLPHTIGMVERHPAHVWVWRRMADGRLSPATPDIRSPLRQLARWVSAFAILLISPLLALQVSAPTPTPTIPNWLLVVAMVLEPRSRSCPLASPVTINALITIVVCSRNRPPSNSKPGGHTSAPSPQARPHQCWSLISPLPPTDYPAPLTYRHPSPQGIGARQSRTGTGYHAVRGLL
jgi:hypothetical protein